MTLTALFLQETATQSGGGGGSLWSMLLMMLLIFVVMWLLMIRPQQKRQKEMNNFRNSLKVGQKIITAGGIFGKIKEIKDTSVLIEVDSNVTMRIDKNMIMKDPSDLEQPQK